MKNQVVLVLSLFLLFAIPFISATDTKITVTTLPNHDVDISVLRHGQVYSLIESYHKNSGSNGNVSITVSTTEAEFDARVWVKKDNTIIKYEKFETGFTSGTPVNLDVFPDWYIKQKEIENSGNFADNDSENLETQTENSEAVTETEDSETTDETESETEEEPNSDSQETEKTTIETSEKNSSALNGITGFFTSVKEKISIKTLAYTFGFIFAIALFTGGFVMLRRRRFSFYPSSEIKQVKIRKLSEKIKEREQKKEQDKKENDEVADAEAKIKELQEKIQQLKNKPQMSEKEKKIAAAKKKLLEDEKELMKLRSEKSGSDDEEN